MCRRHLERGCTCVRQGCLVRPSIVVSHYSCKDWLLFWVPGRKSEYSEASSPSCVNDQRHAQQPGADITDLAGSRFPGSVCTCSCLSHRSCKRDFSVPLPEPKPSWWLHHGPPEASLHVFSSSLGDPPREGARKPNAAQFPHLTSATSLLPFWGPAT